MSCKYIIERHEHGWLICAPAGQRGIPANALDECIKRLWKGGAVIDSGIAHHFNSMGRDTQVVFAVSSAAMSEIWRAEIAQGLVKTNPEVRWWHGTDVGTSSAAMFAALVSPMSYMSYRAAKLGNRSTPCDADDLGRCLRLLEAMSEWRDRLDEVAAAYPDTAWPRIIARWSELEKADPKTQNRILNECHTLERSEP